MTNKCNIPQIRFKGFSGEWKDEKFGQCTLIQRGGSPRPIENFITKSKNGINWIKIGDVATGSRYITKTKERIIPEGEKHSRKVYKGDLILSNSMSFGRPYIMAIDGCIHDGWLLIRDEKKRFSLEYLLQLLSSEYMLNQYKALASGGVVINLNSELVQSTNVFIPNIKEQTKIGNYFQHLVRLIEEKAKKEDKLKSLKKAMLQKMFPKDGATTPEIRFKGFSGEWEEKEIGDLFIVTRGNVLSATETNDKKSTEMPYPVYSSQTKNNGLLGYYKKYLFENAITWTTDGANAGTVKYRQGKFYSTNVNGVLLSKEGYANQAVSEILDSIAWKHVSYVGNPKLMNNVMSKIKIFIPNSIEEQKTIAEFLTKLDSLINLQHQELEKLKNLKKAFLSKMFV